MNTIYAEAGDTISRDALVSLVSQLTGGLPHDPNNPPPPGPKDPVIRRVLERFRHVLGHSVPWSVDGLYPEPWLTVALNPQPLPPRLALATALAQEMIDRTMLLQDLADALPEETQAHVREAMGRRLSLFAGDYCGTIPIPIPIPLPGPSQGDGVAEPIRAVEQVVMGVAFKRAAEGLPSGTLRNDFDEVGDRLIEAGVARA